MTVRIDQKVWDIMWAGVAQRLDSDRSGHGMDHIERVYQLATDFGAHMSGIDENVVSIAALLHDVDDYKLVGRDQPDPLANAKEIMKAAKIPDSLQASVGAIIQSMGYSKSLRGIRPTTLEGMIVSDADMCDALGINGALRAYQYAISDKGSGIIFDREVWPIANMTDAEYNRKGTTHSTDSFINHFFEKLLRLPSMMMTAPGRQEANRRDAVMVNFLRAYFREQGAPKWSEFLEQYLLSRPLTDN